MQTIFAHIQNFQEQLSKSQSKPKAQLKSSAKPYSPNMSRPQKTQESSGELSTKSVSYYTADSTSKDGKSTLNRLSTQSNPHFIGHKAKRQTKRESSIKMKLLSPPYVLKVYRDQEIKEPSGAKMSLSSSCFYSDDNKQLHGQEGKAASANTEGNNEDKSLHSLHNHSLESKTTLLQNKKITCEAVGRKDVLQSEQTGIQELDQTKVHYEQSADVDAYKSNIAVLNSNPLSKKSRQKHRKAPKKVKKKISKIKQEKAKEIELAKQEQEHQKEFVRKEKEVAKREINSCKFDVPMLGRHTKADLLEIQQKGYKNAPDLVWHHPTSSFSFDLYSVNKMSEDERFDNVGMYIYNQLLPVYGDKIACKMAGAILDWEFQDMFTTVAYNGYLDLATAVMLVLFHSKGEITDKEFVDAHNSFHTQNIVFKS
jgi:hypothetical protein